MVKVATSYSEQQVLLCTINPFSNPDLKQHLINGRVPTIRVFTKGKTAEESFSGNQDEAFVRNFLDKVVSKHKPLQTSSERQAVRELKSAREFKELIESSQIPVLVKFSAFF